MAQSDLARQRRLVSRATVFLLVAVWSGCADQAPAPPVGSELAGGGPGGKADGVAVGWLDGELDRWNAGLTEADRAAKFDKMAASPYAFFRGTNHLFWARYGQDARLNRYGGEDETRTWLQGDLHAYNYGAFHDDDGDIVYDLNDFDEAVLGDYQLDLWRMAASIVLVGWENGLDDGDIQTAVEAFAEHYLDTLDDYRGNGDERGASFDEDNTYGRLDDFLDDVADSESRAEMLEDWTVVDDDRRRLDTELDKLAPLEPGLEAAIAAAMPGYGDTLSGGLDWDPDYFAIKSVARRLNAGTGSLGTPRYYVLIEGPSGDNDDDIILDVKRQSAPTAYAYFSPAQLELHRLFFVDQGERVATAQRALLTDVDDHLGWLDLEDGTYSVRERSPWKESFPTEELNSPGRLEKLAEQWGTILATDHARADRDFDDGLVPWSLEREVDRRTDGDHEDFRALVWEVASECASQTLIDYETFLSLL